jgi:hypothetical protein
VRPRGVPALPGLSAFPELNVRTYVRAGEKPGVWFFSLDAGNRLAVEVARRWYHLPYFRARMSCVREGESVQYASRRIHRGAPPAEFRARYRPVGEALHSTAGWLDRWLTERYCLYAADGGGGLHRAEIHHAAWRLAPAEAEIERNTMAAALGFELPPEPPLLHFAGRLEVAAWAPQRVES